MNPAQVAQMSVGVNAEAQAAREGREQAWQAEVLAQLRRIAAALERAAGGPPAGGG